MKWDRNAVLILKKRAFGNIMHDDEMEEKLTQLEAHLENFDNILLSHRSRHEWAEVERLSEAIAERLRQLSVR